VAKNAFEIRYKSKESIDPGKERWNLCTKVLMAKTELLERLNEGW
jgi:hypothetical protein